MVIMSTNTVAVSIHAVSPLLGVGAGAACARTGSAKLESRRAASAAIGRKRKAKTCMSGFPHKAATEAPRAEHAKRCRRFARRVPAVNEKASALILHNRRPN